MKFIPVILLLVIIATHIVVQANPFRGRRIFEPNENAFTRKPHSQSEIDASKKKRAQSRQEEKQQQQDPTSNDANTDLPPHITSQGPMDAKDDAMPDEADLLSTSSSREDRRRRRLGRRLSGAGVDGGIVGEQDGNNLPPSVHDVRNAYAHVQQEILGFDSSTLVATRFCAEDAKNLCTEPDTGAPKRWPDTKRPMSATECLEKFLQDGGGGEKDNKPNRIQNATCKKFLEGRKMCLRDMTQIEMCQAVKPAVALEDRHKHRRIRLESRRARLELRRKITGAKKHVESQQQQHHHEQNKNNKRHGRTMSSSASDSHNSDSNDEGGGPSPSMSMSDELEEKHAQLMQEADNRYEAERKEVLRSSQKTDQFMMLCSALLGRAASDKLSMPCKESVLAREYLKFDDPTTKKYAERRVQMHRTNQDRYKRDREKQDRVLKTLKDRVTRHHLDALDEIEEEKKKRSSSSSSSSMSQQQQDVEQADGEEVTASDDKTKKQQKETTGAFLLNERRERERHRRMKLERHRERFEKNPHMRPGEPINDDDHVNNNNDGGKKKEKSESFTGSL